MARVSSYPEDLRDRPVQAAAERLVSAPPDQLSLRELAASQDTSTNAIYSLFGGKDALIRAVVAEANASFTAAQEAALAQGATLDGLTELGRSYREWALDHPSLYQLMFGPHPSVSPRGEAMRPLELVVTTLLDAGVLRPAPVPVVCRALWAATHGAVLLEMAERPERAEGEEQFAAFQELYLHGLLHEADVPALVGPA